MSLEIRYIDAPEGAQQAMTVASTGKNGVSRNETVAQGGSEHAFATLEAGMWVLDGSRYLLEDDPMDVGWWSRESSGENGEFAHPPVITLTFPAPYTATGFTFSFSPQTDQWCTRLYIAWYNGTRMLADGIYCPEGPEWSFQQTVESFDKMEVTIHSTNRPGDFAKIRQILIGRMVRFGQEELVSVDMVNEADPSACVLTADTMQIEIVNRKNLDLIPQENQRVELWVDGALRAVQYIVSSSRDSRQRYRIRCQSAIGMLEDLFLGGFFLAVPLQTLMEQVIPNFGVEIGPEFVDSTVSGYLPVCTRREALQQIAFAIGAMVSTQGTDKIRLLAVPENTSSVFRQGDLFLGGSTRTEPRAARVTVHAHNYRKDNLTQTILNNQEIHGTDVLLTFDAPHWDYAVTGGTLTDSDVNWIRVRAEGPITVTAKGYEHVSYPFTRKNPAAVAREQGNYVEVKDATLVISTNAQAALDRLYRASQYRQTTEQDVVIRGQRAGDMVASPNAWGTQTRGYITSMDSRFTQGGQTANIVILGMEVEPEGIWNYAGQLFAGEDVVY